MARKLRLEYEGAVYHVINRGKQGHLFGSVSATDIARALQGQGFNIQPDDVNLPGRLDRIDKYMVTIRFAEDLQTQIKVYVAPMPRARN